MPFSITPPKANWKQGPQALYFQTNICEFASQSPFPESTNSMRDDLTEYVKLAESIIADAPQMGETNTKEMLVRRFIEVLGWQFLPSEVQLEYAVRMASRKTKVDYALLLEGTPIAFVEAKGVDTVLSSNHREQITSYLHNEEGVEWGLLTNGKKYQFFRYNGTPSGQLLGELRLEQLPHRSDIVKTLSKESVVAGESRQIAETVRARRVAVSKLTSDKEDVAEEITAVVTNHVGETSISSTVKAEAKALVDRVVNTLEERGEKLEEADSPDAIQSAPSTTRDVDADIVLIEDEAPVSSFDANTQADAMAEAVDFLIEQYDLLDALSIPYVPGKTKAILSDSTSHPDGEEMRSPRTLSGGVYVETHMSKKAKQKELDRLADRCGVTFRYNW